MAFVGSLSIRLSDFDKLKEVVARLFLFHQITTIQVQSSLATPRTRIH
jgi:hypothetical protein